MRVLICMVALLATLQVDAAEQFIMDGIIRAGTAGYADSAGTALVSGSASNAVTAGYATSAGTAGYATTAGTAADPVARAAAAAAATNLLGPLGSTVPGSEGVRLIGADGGYTLERFFQDLSVKGLSRDLPVFTYPVAPTPGLAITWGPGNVYDPLTPGGYHHLIAGSKTLTDNAVNYAYWATNELLQVQITGSVPVGAIRIASFTAAFGQILATTFSAPAGDQPGMTEAAHAAILPDYISEGLLVHATTTNVSGLYMEAGTEYHNFMTAIDHPRIDFTNLNMMVVYGHTNAGSFAAWGTNNFPFGLYDNGTNQVACNPAKWYRGLFIAPQSDHLNYVLPDNVYTSYLDAVAGVDPDLPAGFSPYIPAVTAYVFSGSNMVFETSASYWLDRRLRITQGGTLLVGSTGSANVPTLSSVLQAGNSAGQAITGLPDPTGTGDAANKAYVDSKINNINSGKVFVDQNGNDSLAKLNSSILPYKTIMAAITAAGAVASDSNRFTLQVSAGTYVEHVVMHEDVGMRGTSIEDTVIKGQILYPTSYMDVSGAEVSLLTVLSINEPALVVNSGTDAAYAGIRSCYLSSTYDDATISNKSVALIQRGITEIYGTTYCELYVNTIDGIQCQTTVFEHSTDLLNPGLNEFTSFNSSSIIYCTDTNDIVSMMFTHDNTDANCINQLLGGTFNIYLDDSAEHMNRIELVCNERAQGRTLSMGNATRLYMDPTNNCNLFMAHSANGTAENVAIIRNNHIRVVSGSSSNIWFGAATTTNDNIRIYDTEIIQKNAFNYYPRQYTNDGSSGSFYINTPHQNGDQILGGALDMFTPNSLQDIIYNKPFSGHIKIYLDNTAGLEQPYYMDSTGSKYRICRDTVFLGYNGETNYLNAGEVVYIYDGFTNGAQFVKRAIATDLGIAYRAWGVVNTLGGIAPGGIAPILSIGQTTSPFDTSAFTEGDILYLSPAVSGGLTNREPDAPNVSVRIGWVSVAATNGTMIVHIQKPDVLGNQLPDYYAAASNLVVETNRAIQAEAVVSSRVSVIEGRTNVWNRASTDGISATNRLVVVEGRTSTWNTAAINATNAWVVRVSGLEGQTSTWNTASINATNAWVGRVSGLEGQTSTWNTAATTATWASNGVVLASNRISIVEGRTSVWNQAAVDATSATNQLVALHTAKRFKANFANAYTYTNGTDALAPFTNVVLAASGGSIYSNALTVCRWWPKATNGVVKLYGSMGVTGSASQEHRAIDVYKNGLFLATVIDTDYSTGSGTAHLFVQTWQYVDTATPTVNDYYTVQYTMSVSRSAYGAGTNNWVFGEVTTY